MTDRAVSVSLNYVLTLAITTILMTGLLFATGNVVDDRRDSATRGEFRVVGEQVAASLMDADRLVQSGATEVTLVADGPDTVAGVRYTVSLNGSSGHVVLETTDDEVVVRVPFHNTTAVADSSASGGRLRIVAVDPGGPNEALEVRAA